MNTPNKKQKKTATRTSKTRQEKKVEPTEEEIRTRAYDIYADRGGESGYELDDWLQAERKLRGR